MLTIAGLLCPPLLLDILNFIVDIRVRRSGAGTEQGAGDYRNGLGCGAGFSLQYSLLCLRCRVFADGSPSLGHFGCIGRLLVSCLLRCIIRQRAISELG